MTRYKVETHKVSVRHIVINADSEEEAKKLARDYVDNKSHINPTITYDKKLNIMYPPPVTHASWIRKRLLDPNINALGYGAGVSAVFYAALTAGICIAPAALIGMASTFKMAKSLTSGILTTVEAITSAQKGEVNVFNLSLIHI